MSTVKYRQIAQQLLLLYYKFFLSVNNGLNNSSVNRIIHCKIATALNDNYIVLFVSANGLKAPTQTF